MKLYTVRNKSGYTLWNAQGILHSLGGKHYHLPCRYSRAGANYVTHCGIYTRSEADLPPKLMEKAKTFPICSRCAHIEAGPQKDAQGRVRLSTAQYEYFDRLRYSMGSSSHKFADLATAMNSAFRYPANRHTLRHYVREIEKRGWLNSEKDETGRKIYTLPRDLILSFCGQCGEWFNGNDYICVKCRTTP